jgi:uncharacterized membrane protein YoaK (UPF0700 family)
MVTGIRTGPESLPVGTILAAVGGFLDAYTYVGYRVFANAQTGNVVLFGTDAASGEWQAAVRRLMPIAAFLLGVLTVEVLDSPPVRRALPERVHAVLALEILLLAVVASLPDDAPEASVTVTVAFAAALQFATFRVLAGTPCTTMLASGNLRATAVAGYRWLLTREESAWRTTGRFAAVVGAFVAGALLGGLVTKHLGTPAVAIAAGMLLVVAGFIIRENRPGRVAR